RFAAISTAQNNLGIRTTDMETSPDIFMRSRDRTRVKLFALECAVVCKGVSAGPPLSMPMS
ncbi:MAG: hypothetical protein WBQ54_19050, partial [Pseudolabrys sp.]